MEGAFDRTWQTLRPYVNPLVVSVGLNETGDRGAPMELDGLADGNR